MTRKNTLVKRRKGYYDKVSKVILLISLLSLGGLPPFIGFVYKWVIFDVLLKKKFLIVCSVLIFFSLVSLFFYLKVCFSNKGVY